MTKPLLIATAAGSLLVGFGVGYKVAERRLSNAFDERLDKETRGMREFYTAAKKPYSTPQEAAADLLGAKVVVSPKADPDIVTIVQEPDVGQRTEYHKIVTNQGYTPTKPEDKTQTLVDMGDNIVVHNVFSKNERDPEIPYIISQEEFMQNETGWPQVTVSYYREDDVLTDEREDIIEDLDKSIGRECLQHFGLESSDPRTVHVRNEKLNIDFEVVLNETSYHRDVLGLETDGPPDLASGRVRKDR